MGRAAAPIIISSVLSFAGESVSNGSCASAPIFDSAG